MSVLLLILKVIGIILLLILGIILLAVLLLLFVPVRYSAKAAVPEDLRLQKPDILFEAGWLLKLVYFRFTLHGKDADAYLRLAWIRKKKGGRAPDAADEDADEGANGPEAVFEAGPETEVVHETVSEAEAVHETVSETEAVHETVSETEAVHETVSAPASVTEAWETADGQPSGHEENGEHRQTGKKPVFSGLKKKKTDAGAKTERTDPETGAADKRPDRGKSLRKLGEKVSGAILSIPEKTVDLLLAINDALYGKTEALERMADRAADKVDGIRRKAAAFTKEPIPSYLLWLKGRALRMLRHYRIRSIEGYVDFGTGSPDTTAWTGGLLYMLLPASAEAFELRPDLEETCFDADVRACGHIRICHAAALLLRMALKRDTWRIIKRLRGKNRR